MSTRINIGDLTNIVFTISVAFTTLLINTTFPSPLTSQLTASLFTATAYVVVYFLRNVIHGYKTVSYRRRIYLDKSKHMSLNKVYSYVDEVIVVILAYVIGYVMAYVFAGVTDFKIFIIGFTIGIVYRLFLLRYVMFWYNVLSEKIAKPIYLLAISAPSTVILYAYVLTALYIIHYFFLNS